jgi:sterol desaturase/sphingolipid hydroxylase (fatty acid hydroxylase superfamily)
MLLLTAIAVAPLAVFIVLAWSDSRTPRRIAPAGWDIALNLVSFAMQGAVVPGLGYVISVALSPMIWPAGEAALGLGFGAAFLLNFVGVDFLYYWQHRLFHQPQFWPLHRCHHASPWLYVWATARNTLITNCLFVYLLVSPVLAYVAGSAEGFFAGAMATAALDLLRHSRLDLERPRWLSRLLVTPRIHHRHHDARLPVANFGANLVIWDRLFGTARFDDDWPTVYAAPDAPPPLAQLLHPIPVGLRRRFDHALGPGAATAQEPAGRSANRSQARVQFPS